MLNKLNPQEIYKDLGDNAVLLCYEKFAEIEKCKTFCHRHIVAEWLEKNLGKRVEELTNEKQSDNKQLHF